jgi:ERCC4-type nuclease
VLVSPTEPALLRKLGTTSLVPEQYGVDFLWTSPHFGLVGVQRKEVKDFVASVRDGRLTKEVGQMKSLGLSMLVLEGKATWTNDGMATFTQQSWTTSQHYGTLWSLQSQGCWISTTISLQETSELLQRFLKWAAKQRHSSLASRTTPSPDEWGTVGNREWAIHLLQGFKGIGPVQAAAIYDWFDGVPISWDVDAIELVQIPGIGEKRAEAMINALRIEDE